MKITSHPSSISAQFSLRAKLTRLSPLRDSAKWQIAPHLRYWTWSPQKWGPLIDKDFQVSYIHKQSRMSTRAMACRWGQARKMIRLPPLTSDPSSLPKTPRVTQRTRLKFNWPIAHQNRRNSTWRKQTAMKRRRNVQWSKSQNHCSHSITRMTRTILMRSRVSRWD